MAGIRKASVFPLPVHAAPIRSFPRSNGGIALAWISVMCVKPMSIIPCMVGSQMSPSREEKVVSDKMLSADVSTGISNNQ